MKIVRVQYTTTESYASTNKKNIGELVEELRKINHPGIKYSAYVLEDGKTFMHLDHFANEAAHEFLQDLPSFKKFASELWNSGLEVKPKLDLLSVAGSTLEFAGQ
jgi:quinol monooxygenase YgiN